MTKLHSANAATWLLLALSVIPVVSTSTISPAISTGTVKMMAKATKNKNVATVEEIDSNGNLMDTDDMHHVTFYGDTVTCESDKCLSRDLVSCEIGGKSETGRAGFRCFSQHVPKGYGFSKINIRCEDLNGKKNKRTCRLIYSLAPMSDFSSDQYNSAGEMFTFLCLVGLCCCLLISMDPFYDYPPYYVPGPAYPAYDGYAYPRCGRFGPYQFAGPAWNPYASVFRRNEACPFKHGGNCCLADAPPMHHNGKELTPKVSQIPKTQSKQSEKQGQAKIAPGIAEKAPTAV